MKRKSSSRPRVFVQTARAGLEKMDRWRQMTRAEAKVAWDMTMRNELSGGTPVVRKFEATWRKMTGLKYAITLTNGTASLYSAMFGLGIGPGDEVISPSWNWICSIAPAPLLGARPVFCDCDPETLLADPADIRRKITRRTKAIVVVHLWGMVCDMDAIMKVSRETGVPVIEDCSHAHGARYRGRPVGTFGRVGCWSLQGSKPVSAGEGGVLATNDLGVFDRACLVGQANRIAGIDLQTTRYRAYQPLGTGMKFRAHPLAIGIASVQLRRLPKVNAGRRGWIEAVEKGLREFPFLEPVRTYPHSGRAGFYGFPVHFRPERAGKVTVGEFANALNAEKVRAGTNPYPLLHLLPYFAKGFDLFTRRRGPMLKGYRGYRPGDLPNIERAVKSLVFLPVLTEPVRGAVPEMLSRIRRASRRLKLV
jgi:perosamine synthetase